MNDNYIPGDGCECGAWNESECGCGVDWTPRRQKELEVEVAEQARLLGMSAEREAALRGELDRLKQELANMKDQRDCAMWIIEQKEKNETSERSDKNRHNVAQTGQTHEN